MSYEKTIISISDFPAAIGNGGGGGTLSSGDMLEYFRFQLYAVPENLVSHQTFTPQSSFDVIGTIDFPVVSIKDSPILAFCNGGVGNANRMWGVFIVAGDYLSIKTWNGSEWTTVVTGTTVVTSEAGPYNLHLKVEIGAAGRFRMYLNGILECDSGILNTVTNTHTACDTLQFGSIGNIAATTTQFSGFCISDADLPIGSRVVQIKPTGEGTYSDMAGAYTDVDEVGTPDDTDALVASTPNQKSSFSVSSINSGYASGWDIVCVEPHGRAFCSDGSSGNLRLTLDDGSNISESGDNSLSVSPDGYQSPFYTAPDGGAWEYSDLAGIKLGVKVTA